MCKYGKIYIYQCSLYVYLSMYTRMIYICMVYLYRQDFSDPVVTSARVASDRSLRLSSIQLVCVKHRAYVVNDVSQFVVGYHPVGGWSTRYCRYHMVSSHIYIYIHIYIWWWYGGWKLKITCIESYSYCRITSIIIRTHDIFTMFYIYTMYTLYLYIIHVYIYKLWYIYNIHIRTLYI